MATRKLTIALRAAVAVAASSFAAGVYSFGHISGWLKSGLDAAHSFGGAGDLQSAEVSNKQTVSGKAETIGEYVFPAEKVAVGSIDFDEEMTVQLFRPYQGKLLELFAKVGDEVKKAQTRFTIDSPDSSLIAAAGVLEPTSRHLARLKALYETRANSQKGLEQTTSDPQTDEGALTLDGGAREGDGAMTAWVTNDRRCFNRRKITVGIQKDGFRQILEGLQVGELVATDGAVFLSNILVIGQTGG
jgi:multidrug efflux pump subunit AcrA (membrane-fusion protein)